MIPSRDKSGMYRVIRLQQALHVPYSTRLDFPLAGHLLTRWAHDRSRSGLSDDAFLGGICLAH